MALILRKCWKNGHSSHNFYYGNVGDIVTAPNWDSKPECGNGLHGLLEGNGDWVLLEGSIWLVIEAETEDIVEIINNLCKFRTGKILFRGTTEELRSSEFSNKFNLNEESAYLWARHIGNQDVMIDKIANSENAYRWARHIGNQDVMIDKITESEYAYYWALNIGNEDVMINKITSSYWAIEWAEHIGNHDVMKPKVTNKYYTQLWNQLFPNNQI